MRSRDPKIFEFYVLKVSDVLIHLNLGPYRTKTPEICNLGPDQDQQKNGISDRTRPGPTKILKPRTRPDYEQQIFENLGPIRTDRSSEELIMGIQIVAWF